MCAGGVCLGALSTQWTLQSLKCSSEFGSSEQVRCLCVTLHACSVCAHRLVQEPGSFVVAMPGAYTCSISTGFCVAEAVGVGPWSWLPHGADAARKARALGRPTPFSMDQLLMTLVSRGRWLGALMQQACAAAVDDQGFYILGDVVKGLASVNMSALLGEATGLLLAARQGWQASSCCQHVTMVPTIPVASLRGGLLCMLSRLWVPLSV